MLCPLYHAETLTKYLGAEEKQIVSAHFLPCIESRCGWWEKDGKQCAVLALARKPKEA